MHACMHACMHLLHCLPPVRQVVPLSPIQIDIGIEYYNNTNVSCVHCIITNYN